jgi:type III restriction enzyme
VLRMNATRRLTFADELLLAEALDRDGRGVWARNPPTPHLGFSVPLPTKVGESKSFYPDFLWWVDDICWAIDPTGRHLLEEKIRGKLVAMMSPRVALAARGKINLKTGAQESPDGWTLVIARAGLSPLVEYADELGQILEYMVPRHSVGSDRRRKSRPRTRSR